LLERQGDRSPPQVRRDLTVPIPAVAWTPGPGSPGCWMGRGAIPGRNQPGLWTAAGGSRICMQGARRCPIRRPMATGSVHGAPGPAMTPRRPRRPHV